MASRSRRFPVATDRRFRKANECIDHGTRERWRHTGCVLIQTEKPGVLAAKATEEHILDVLVARNLLTKIHLEAALRFKLDYQRAALVAHVTGSYSLAQVTRDNFHTERERNDFEEAAYQRWRNAVSALGIKLSGRVIAVVCHDVMLTTADIQFLQAGLDRLARWYGMLR